MKRLLLLAFLFLFCSLYASEDHPQRYPSIKNAIGRNYSKDSKACSNIHHAEGHFSHAGLRRNQFTGIKYFTPRVPGSFSTEALLLEGDMPHTLIGRGFAYFKPISLKLIFPKHYFW